MDIDKIKKVIDNAKVRKDCYGDKKDDLAENAIGIGMTKLAKYNKILDHISKGPHTKIDFIYDNLEWTFRLITADEFANIHKEHYLLLQQNVDVVEKVGSDVWFIKKVLSLAMSESPFKTEDVAYLSCFGVKVNYNNEQFSSILTAEDLGSLPWDYLEDLYKHYIYYTTVINKAIEQYDEQEIKELIDIIKKKPELMKDLELMKLRAVTDYLLKYYVTRAEILKSD